MKFMSISLIFAVTSFILSAANAQMARVRGGTTPLSCYGDQDLVLHRGETFWNRMDPNDSVLLYWTVRENLICLDKVDYLHSQIGSSSCRIKDVSFPLERLLTDQNNRQLQQQMPQQQQCQQQQTSQQSSFYEFNAAICGTSLKTIFNEAIPNSGLEYWAKKCILDVRRTQFEYIIDN